MSSEVCVNVGDDVQGVCCIFFFFSSRRRHTRCREVSWARRCVQETGINAEYMGIMFKDNGEEEIAGDLESDRDQEYEDEYQISQMPIIVEILSPFTLESEAGPVVEMVQLPNITLKLSTELGLNLEMFEQQLKESLSSQGTLRDKLRLAELLSQLENWLQCTNQCSLQQLNDQLQILFNTGLQFSVSSQQENYLNLVKPLSIKDTQELINQTLASLQLSRVTNIKSKEECFLKTLETVSYTHLTLPTILLVQISVVAVSLKKKK
eukprot:TRINITY_DN44324_c0_g1_i2.p1 TRINITY_DN44324_c0_g1~~TRINITY_DN44324_c0_g1_i2.p1  ORF type:complete len:265 (+),score=76.62 TRINITY_DN44324_c0_g1_i2:58-852(+)